MFHNSRVFPIVNKKHTLYREQFRCFDNALTQFGGAIVPVSWRPTASWTTCKACGILLGQGRQSRGPWPNFGGEFGEGLFEFRFEFQEFNVEGLKGVFVWLFWNLRVFWIFEMISIVILEWNKWIWVLFKKMYHYIWVPLIDWKMKMFTISRKKFGIFTIIFIWLVESSMTIKVKLFII